jgi:archaemetzincin
MKYFYLGATPEVERPPFEAVCRRMAAEYGAPVKEIILPSVEFAYDPGRQQYRSLDVLEMLARNFPADAAKLLALTGRDLFVPVLTFVFGQAQLGGRVAVVSLARLRQEFYGMAPNQEIFMERTVKEALHETGHTFGLVHCSDQRCAMSLATNVRQIDGKNGAWCATCAARLRRVKGIIR